MVVLVVVVVDVMLRMAESAAAWFEHSLVSQKKKKFLNAREDIMESLASL